MGASKLGVFLSAARSKGGGISEIQQDDVTVATNVSILNFAGQAFLVTDEGGGKVTVRIGSIVTHEFRQDLTPLPDGPLVVVDNSGAVVRSFI